MRMQSIFVATDDDGAIAAIKVVLSDGTESPIFRPADSTVDPTYEIRLGDHAV